MSLKLSIKKFPAAYGDHHTGYVSWAQGTLWTYIYTRKQLNQCSKSQYLLYNNIYFITLITHLTVIIFKMTKHTI